MNTNITALPASETFTPEQALASAQQLDPQDILVVGYDRDGDLMVRSSRMTRMDALWLCEQLKRWVIGELD